MKKLIMTAVAACVFALLGMASAANLPAGWSVGQQDGFNVYTKSSSGVTYTAVTMPGNGKTPDAIAREIAQSEGCSVGGNGLEVDCPAPDKMTIRFDPAASNGNVSYVVITCGKADDATCQKDANEIMSAVKGR